MNFFPENERTNYSGDIIRMLADSEGPADNCR